MSSKNETIELPETIEQKISELKKQLEESRRHYQYSLICGSEWSDDMIGFFNMGRAKELFTLLNNGRKLQLRHSVYGNFNVYMNPQCNRILVENEDGSDLERLSLNTIPNSSSKLVYKSPINEDTIISFIVWHGGDWYLKKEDAS